MLKIIFVDGHGQEKTVETEPSGNLMKLAQASGYESVIEGTCGGAMACATCHVIVDPAWYGKLPPPTTDETDMLDLASGLTKTSRLSCQIKLTDALDGLKVKLPPVLKGLFR